MKYKREYFKIIEKVRCEKYENGYLSLGIRLIN